MICYGSEFVEGLVFLGLWLFLDSSWTTSAQRPVKSPSDQRFAQSLTILECVKLGTVSAGGVQWNTFSQHHKLAPGVHIQERRQNGIQFCGDRPDHVSQAPLGTRWRIKTWTLEIEEKEGTLTKDSEWGRLLVADLAKKRQDQDSRESMWLWKLQLGM